MNRKTGVRVEFSNRATLKDQAWNWEVDEAGVTITLDGGLFGHLDQATAQPMVAMVLAQLVESEYRAGNVAVPQQLFSPEWNELIAGWATEPQGISPRLARLLLKAVVNKRPPDLRIVH